MKTKIILKVALALFMIITGDLQAQQAKTGACLGTFPATPFNSTRAWLRGGNNASGAGNIDNIFGTCFNSPIYTITNNTVRTWLNGTQLFTQPLINGVVFGNTATTANTSGYFGIGFSGGSSPLNPTGGTGPMSLLHLQGPNNTPFPGGGAGWRSWMKTGTFTIENTDATYMGLKSEAVSGGTNRSDAVINWSDDPNVGGGGPDNLRFIFTQFANSGLGNCTNCPLNAQGFEGMEIARMTAENGYGRMGVGPLFTATLPPARRLHADDGVTGNAQLRTSYALSANPALGTWSDFQTTSLGDMYFNTRIAGGPRRFGFHTSTPGNTVEINSQPGVPYFGNIAGSSGLRLKNMIASANTLPNPGSGVLSVDAAGDVIYVPGGNTAANNGVSVAGGVIQLGVPCNIGGIPNVAGILATALTADRVIPNFNQNLWIASLNTSTGGVGVGGQPNVNAFCNTGNTFEISANSKNPQYGSVDASGLRLTKLLSTSPPVANGVNGVNSARVLTVDGDGDVVLTNVSGGFGAACGGGAAPFNLSADTRVGLNSFNLYFDGNFSGNKLMDNVVIGKNCVNPLAKLDVLQSSNDVGTIGINILNTDQADNGLGIPVIGIKSVVNNPNYNCRKIAGWFEATPAPCLGNTVQYAIIVPPSGGYSGFGTLNPNATVQIVGSGLMNANPITSDASLKTDVQPLQNSLSKIRNLSGVSFNWIPSMVTDTFMSGTHYGFIAQAIEAVLPDVVRTTSDGTKAIEYQQIIPVAVEAIKQLDSAITKINSVPDAPVLISPANGATLDTNAILFTWNNSVGSVSSEFQVARVSDFSTLLASSRTVISDINSFALNGNFQDTNPFYWRVRMHNGAGAGAWSEVRTITLIHTPPPAPVLISPADGTAGNFCGPQQFTWHKIPQAPTQYNFQVARDAAFTNIVAGQGEIIDTTVTITIGLTPNNFSFNLFLQPGADTGTYYWRVCAIYNGTAGQFSQAFTFNNTTICGGGDVLIGFDVATGFGTESDSRLKTNVAPITSALDKVSQLNGISYDWLHDNPRYDFDSTRQIGFIAQDVQVIVPEVVRADSNGYLTLDYGRMVPVLVEAIKELKTWKDSVQNATARTIAPSENFNRQDIKLMLSDAPLLGDARPNPNSGKAEIPYYLPEQTTNAKIIFTDMLGRIMDERSLVNGYGLLNINTQELPAGNYFYSLVINGNKIDSKTMIKTR